MEGLLYLFFKEQNYIYHGIPYQMYNLLSNYQKLIDI